MAKRYFIRTSTALATTLRALLIAGAAVAQTEAQDAKSAPLNPKNDNAAVQEVVVTAERFSSNVQKTPVAVSAFNTQILAQRQITNVLQAAAQIPGIVITPATGTSTSARIVLRGAGAEQSGVLFDPAVGIYIDNVYQPRINGAFFDFFDIDRLEVLRGPQGTLYGRNTSGGAIKIISKRPSFTWTTSGDAAFGDYNLAEARGLVSGPIIPDKVAFLVSGVWRTRDGFIDAPAYGRKVDNKDTRAARFKLLLTPIDKFEIEAAFDVQSDRSDPGIGVPLQTGAGVVDPAATGAGRDLTTTELFGPFYAKLDSHGGSVNAHYDINSALRLNAISGYRLLRAYQSAPFWISAAAQVPGTTALNSGGTSQLRDVMFSQELNATLTTEKLKGVAGFFYFDEEGRQNFLPPYTATVNLADINRTTEAVALFSQGTYQILPKVGLTAGIRWTDEQANYNQFYPNQAPRTRQAASKSFVAYTPKFGIDWEVFDSLLAYFSYTKGFKSGGFNQVPPSANTGVPGVAGGPVAYLPETVESFEGGLKYTTPNRRFRTNIAIFEADYTGLQLPVFFPGTSTSYTSNATGAVIQGIEIEPTWQATSSLQFYGNMSFEKGHYTAPFACTLANTSLSTCENKRIKGLVPAKIIVGVVYAPKLPIPGQLRFAADFDHTDAYFNNVANEIQLVQTPEINLFNGSVNWDSPSGHWGVALEGRNLANEHYVLAGLQLASAVRPSVTGYPGDPRVIDVRLKWKF